jgi:hypothetical protein
MKILTNNISFAEYETYEDMLGHAMGIFGRGTFTSRQIAGSISDEVIGFNRNEYQESSWG